MKRFILAGMLLGSSLAFIGAAPNAAGSDPDIRGKITIIQRATADEGSQIVGRVMVEADKKDAKVDKANLIITGKTRVLKQQGEEREKATFEELKVGQTVAAEFMEGPTIMIYPLQVEASEIVILTPPRHRRIDHGWSR